MATNIVKTLKFPGSDDSYQINAAYLDGLTRSQIEERFNTIESFDALRYMGTVTAGETAPGAFTPKADKGDTYKVVGSGYVNGIKVENGDMLICNTDNTAAADASSYIAQAEKWDIIQVNIDVDAILDHYHEGEVTFTSSEKTITHTPELSTEDITAQFTNGTASVTDTHSHTATGSVTITTDGDVEATSITPAGNVTIGSGSDVTVVTGVDIVESANNYLTGVTVEDHVHSHTGNTDTATDTVTGAVTISQGSGTANYTPSGTVSESASKFVTDVSGATTTVSAHSASSENAGGFTPSGTVTLDSYTPDGSVTGNVSVTSSFTSTSQTGAVMSDSVTYTSAGNDGLDGILTFGTEIVVTGVSGDVTSNATPELSFTGSAVTIGATFKGEAVAAHKHDVNVADHAAFIPQVDVDTASHTHSFTGDGAHLAATFSEGKTTGHTHSFTTNAETLVHGVGIQSEKHTHTITPTTKDIGATFTGTAASHAHSFNGISTTNTIDVTVNSNTQTLVGTVTGDISLTNATGVVKGVNIAAHKISTVDSGSFKTSIGKAE